MMQNLNIINEKTSSTADRDNAIVAVGRSEFTSTDEVYAAISGLINMSRLKSAHDLKMTISLRNNIIVSLQSSNDEMLSPVREIYKASISTGIRSMLKDLHHDTAPRIDMDGNRIPDPNLTQRLTSNSPMSATIFLLVTGSGAIFDGFNRFHDDDQYQHHMGIGEIAFGFLLVTSALLSIDSKSKNNAWNCIRSSPSIICGSLKKAPPCLRNSCNETFKFIANCVKHSCTQPQVEEQNQETELAAEAA